MDSFGALEATFRSLRKEAKERLYLSFHRAYILSVVLVIILGILYIWTINANSNTGYKITAIEAERSEKEQTIHLLRSEVANQESLQTLFEQDDKTRPLSPEDISYLRLPDTVKP